MHHTIKYHPPAPSSRASALRKFRVLLHRQFSHSGSNGADGRDLMHPCPKPRPRRRDRLGIPEHEGHEAHTRRRGRPISRGAGLGLLLLPVQYTAALRPAARPSIPSTEPYRPLPGGRESGDFQGSSSSRRCGVALDAEHAGQAMFPAQQAGDRRDGSPAAGGPAVRKEEERRGSNGGGEVDLLGQAAVLGRRRRRHHRHHHKGTP